MAVISDAEFAQALGNIDWQRPWLAILREVGEPLAHLGIAQGGQAVREALNELAATCCVVGNQQGVCNAQGMPIQFIAQEELPSGQAYEAHIYATGKVPTRANLHDFFNALIWLHFPRIKSILNLRQAKEIEHAGIQASRGGTRDAATLFDENAVIFLSKRSDLIDALENFQWQTLLVENREAWGNDCCVLPFGHALLEKLVHPYKAITGHAWKVFELSVPNFENPIPNQFLYDIDRNISQVLQGVELRSRDFSPLPVLGIPSWWEENKNPSFYHDTQVFRLGRHNRS